MNATTTTTDKTMLRYTSLFVRVRILADPKSEEQTSPDTLDEVGIALDLGILPGPQKKDCADNRDRKRKEHLICKPYYRSDCHRAEGDM